MIHCDKNISEYIYTIHIGYMTDLRFFSLDQIDGLTNHWTDTAITRALNNYNVCRDIYMIHCFPREI